MRRIIPDLLPSTQYAIQVRTISPSGASEWSRRFLVLTDTNSLVPDSPTAVTWVPSGNSFHGEWNAVATNLAGGFSKVVRYEVELTANSVVRTESVLPHDVGKVVYDLGFETNRVFFTAPQPVVAMRVRAVDSAGLKGVWSSSITATNAAPNPPTAAVVRETINAVDLSWTASTSPDVIGYAVYAGTTAGFTPSAANRRDAGNSLGLNYVSATYSLTYFKIRAYDDFGQESVDLTAQGTPSSPFGVDTTPPATPTALAATISIDSSLRSTAAVTWTQTVPTPNDLAGFQIRYRRAGDTNWMNATVGGDDRAATVVLPIPYSNYEFQIRAYDFAANFSAWTATTTATAPTNVVPSQPAAPTVASNTQQVQVTVPGTKAAGGAMEADVNFYEVYASTTTGFTPATANMLGTIPVGPAMVATFQIPTSGGGATQTWFVKIIAVDNGGLKSAASAQATATPNLIAAANITDATITSAKIANLAADKIIAGTGLIADLSVKSKLTMGDGVTQGSIETFGYTAGGTTGFHIGSDGLTIKSGVIEARALNIQSGQNLMPPAYADFPLASYTGQIVTNLGTGSAGTWGVTTAQNKYGGQSLSITLTTAGTTPFIDVNLSSSSATAGTNIYVDDTKSYIFSFWAMALTGSGDKAIRAVENRAGTGVLLTGTPTLVANSVWQRFSFPYTPPAGTNKVSFKIRLTQVGTIYVDGVQLEEQIAGSTSPSSFTPPSSTTINGGQIRTGSIQSSATITVNGVAQPAWSINTSGSAVLGNASVRGVLIVGNTGGTDTDAGASLMQSANFAAGLRGWQVRSDGVVEFRQMAADSIHGDAIQSGTLTVDSIGPGTLGQDITLTGAITAGGPLGERVTFSGDGFTVVGPDPDNATYVNFPTDSGIPNIISGTLKATTLEVAGDSVGNAASFKADSTMEPGSRLFLTGAIGNPTSGPTLRSFWNYIQLEEVTGFRWGRMASVYKGHDGLFRGMWDDGVNYYARLTWNADGTFNSRTTLVGDTVTRREDLVYVPSTGGHYAQLIRADDFYQIEIYSTAFVLQSTYTLSIPLMTTNTVRMGYNWTNNTLIINGKTSDMRAEWREYSVATTGVVTDTGTRYVQGEQQYTYLSGPVAANLDYGSLRYISSEAASLVTYVRPVPSVSGANMARASADEFPTAYKKEIRNFDYDPSTSRLSSFSGDGQYAWYENNMWPTTTSSTWNFKYLWYKDAVEHSAPSPASSLVVNKRSKVSATITAVPAGATAAYLYRAVGAGTYGLVGTILPPSIVWKSTFPITQGTAIMTTNTFAGGNPGQIVSSTGNSFWKGDDTAQFYQLVLNSSANAASTAGNKPALRIGNPAAAHLRIDANSIISMASDTATATMFLPHFRARTTLQSGQGTINITAANTGTSVAVTFPTPFAAVPNVWIGAIASTPNAQVSVAGVTVNGFTAYAQRSTATALTFAWFAHDDA